VGGPATTTPDRAPLGGAGRDAKSTRHSAYWLLAALAIQGCAATGVLDAPSANHNSRIDYVVIHHTSENFAESLRLLTQPTGNPVSAHYLVPEPDDPSYDRRRLRVYSLVPESRRAWHAGKSYWAGEEALNDRSIGIEIVNVAYCTDAVGERVMPGPDEPLCFFPDYSEEQIALVIDLLQGILKRYPEIDPVDIVGHADIAPDRKVDPGPRFPWQRLFRAGIGAWYDEAVVLEYWERFREQLPPVMVLQHALGVYGYRVEATGCDDEQSRAAWRAFQMHFRPSGVTGVPDAATAAILYALIGKYRADALPGLADYASDTTSEPCAPVVPGDPSAP